MTQGAFNVQVVVVSIRPTLVRFVGGTADVNYAAFPLRDATQGTGYYTIAATSLTPVNSIVPMSPLFRGDIGGSNGGGLNLVYDPGHPPQGAPVMPTLTIAANLRLVTNIDPTQAYYGSYEAFQALYPGVLGELPIYGQAPETFAATINIPYYTNPTAAQYRTGPGMFIDPSPPQLLSQNVSTTVGGGTLTGLSPAYVDADGNSWTSVNWQWVMIADTGQYGAATGSYKQQVLQYTGDGTGNRHINTALNLSSGVITVWLQSDTNSDVSCMRHTGMTGTTSAETFALQTTLGIMSFDATGFVVTYGLVAGQTYANATGVKYTAIIMQDTTSDNRYLSVGTYTGNAAASRDITLSGTGTPTHVWVFGRSGAYRSSAFVGVDAIANFGDSAATATGTAILSLAAGKFTIGAGINVNGNFQLYYYAALKADAAFLAQQLFVSFTGTGAGAGTVVSGLGMTPSVVMAEAFEITPPSVTFHRMVWRGPDHVSTDSDYWNANVGLTAGEGISAVGSGTVTLGVVTAPAGVTYYGYAWAGGSASFNGPSNFVAGDGTTAITVSTVVNPDGSVSTIDTVSAGVGLPVVASPQWWCNATLGQALYQINSPGAGWIACSGPASTDGWYLSTKDYASPVFVVSGGKPANPRTWTDISAWATGNAGMLGGSPAASCVFENALIYPATGYTVGTTYPSLRVWDGRQDRELCKIPATPAFVVPQAVLSMLAANATVYFSTFDSGTTSANWSGRVMQVNPISGQVVPLGAAFAAGEMPYALAWHMGRLWCGTNNGIGTVGKVYYFRPGIDTVWTLDYSLATSSVGGVDAMISFLGKLYVGADNAAAANGVVLVRDTAGAYTTTETGSGGTAVVNNGYLALVVYQGNLYASYWNNAAGTAVAKIRKYTGSAWSTVFTGATVTLKPYILLFEDHGFVYAVGGKTGLVGSILSSAVGTSWTDVTADLPPDASGETLLPMYGAVVI